MCGVINETELACDHGEVGKLSWTVDPPQVRRHAWAVCESAGTARSAVVADKAVAQQRGAGLADQELSVDALEERYPS